MAHLLKKVQDFIIYLTRDIHILTHPEYRKIEEIVHDSVLLPVLIHSTIYRPEIL
jgi:hypothetical protein